MALAKLTALYVGIGYPERWQDYSDLTVDPMDAVGNLRRVADRNYRRALARLGQPVDMTEWWMAPQTVGAVLVFQQNALTFSAALLQAPKYDPTASDAANYGAIGAIVGHEASHFVDPLGAEYEADGRCRRWWTPEDSAGFQGRGGRRWHGSSRATTRSRTWASTASSPCRRTSPTSAAFPPPLTPTARASAPGPATPPTCGGRTGSSSLALPGAGAARSARARSAPSSPATTTRRSRYRIATVRNLDAWYDAFDVRPGERLYLAPAARVRIW